MVTYREFEMKDYQAVYRLWKATPGLGLSSADEQQAIEMLVTRNPGLCFVAEQDGEMIGTAFCGQDGRRGYIHHTAVAQMHRRKGIGQKLVELCLHSLAEQGIQKCHLFVMADNELGRSFWKQQQWMERSDLVMFSRNISK